MLQRLLDLKPEVLCDTVHGALTGILRQVLVTGHAAVDLVGRATDPAVDARLAFDRVRSILVQAHFIDVDAPVSETKAGIQKIRIPNPYYRSLHLPARLRIDRQSDPAAVLLHAFVVLRIRYQTTVGPNPTIRLETAINDDVGLDVLYLAADCFTERYPVNADIAKNGDNATLTLTGEPMLVVGGLTWARDDYVRCRDACLLIRPLREALDGPIRPLVVPREVRGSLGVVRVRLPLHARERTKSLRWLSTIQQLRHPAGAGAVVETPGPVGEHFSVSVSTGGYIAAGGEAGTDVILPVRSLAPTGARQVIVPEGDDGSIAISLEAIGGAREIGANSYYYTFGHRGILIDAGFDATREGWLGLPSLERLPRVDAIVLTHAHLDHIGAVPTLLAAFPNVPVYCTRATLAVLLPQLADSAKVSDLRFQQTGEMPALLRGLVDSIRLEQFRLLDYHVPSLIPEIPGLTLKFFDAGHVIGSACARFEFGGVSILHTGDISVEDQHLLRGMPVAEVAADHIIMEGTYSGDPDFGRLQRRAAVDQFLTALAERIDDGGSVLLPAFSLGKAQELVALLVTWNEQKGRSVPIRTVGMVNRINEVSVAHTSFFPKLVGNPFAQAKPFPQAPNPIDNVGRREWYGRTFFEFADHEPCVVIASHGMMTEETGSYLIGRAILGKDDQRHAILLTGYMDPRSPGFRLIHQKDEAVIDFGPGDVIMRRIPAQRIQFHRVTSHASYEELVEVALSVPNRSVTFIHGDGQGLDGLVADLRQRLDATGRNLVIRAPAIGERVLIDRVKPPDAWDVDVSDPGDAPSLGPGRKFVREAGLSVRGLTDGRWALIPIGHASVTLALESDHIDPSRIDSVELRPHRGTASIAFDRARNHGDLSRIVLTEPGKIALAIMARDPSGQPIPANITVSCGAEIRAVRTALDAADPVLELEVGGNLEPQVLDVTAGRDRRPLPVQRISWEPISRRLRLHFRSASAVGTVDDVHLSVRWPNGFTQSGPTLGGFTLEPRIDFEPAPAWVGVRSRFRIRCTPEPVRARVGGQICAMDGNDVAFVPSTPGKKIVELEYPTLEGDREWREIASLHVQPAATMDLPAGTDVSKGLEVTIRDVEPSLHGEELVLSIGGETRDRWTASGAAHAWSGDVSDTDPLDVAVLAPTNGLTLCAGSVRIYSAFEFNANESLPVTTTDGACEAELAFVGPSGWNRRVVEDALSAAGFIVRGWVDGVLRVAGSDRTLGSRIVSIADGSRKINVQVVTLSDLHLTLARGGPFEPGDGCTVHTSGGEITTGLSAIDGGPLVITAERVEPFFDELSARVAGNRVHFLHPGRFTVSLIASGRRLASVDANVGAPQRPRAASAPTRIERMATSAYDASVAAAGCVAYASTVILSPLQGQYRILQDHISETEELLWRFLNHRLDSKENVLVSWPGLALGELGGRLLRRLRGDQPNIPVAHLSYPAPRGEIASDERHARSLLAHRVLCCARASATIDRLDAYRCVKCEGTPHLRTDRSRIWQECPNCGRADSGLVLTLAGLRSSDFRVLFADYRMAKYLSRGRGRRYAGTFGRSVRCGNCSGIQTAYATPEPWDRAELRRLVLALASTWDAADRATSIRRAAYIAAGRVSRSRPSDIARLEDALNRLVDAGLVHEGKATDQRQFERLEAGVSVCCARPLVWSKRRASCLFLDIEELLNPEIPTSSHPDLACGQAGVRQFLTLSE